jgi:hypothetical protein
MSEEANRIIRASLLDEPYPPHPKDALSAKRRSRKPVEDAQVELRDLNGDPAALLEVANLFDVLKKELTPAERRDLELLEAEPDRNKIASETGRTRGAVDVSAHRIKKKLNAL